LPIAIDGSKTVISLAEATLCDALTVISAPDVIVIFSFCVLEEC